ncbi:MAG: ATP-binding cassette domain-containing protein [Rhizobiales bacterium]|nr:ATP-binding cassette domain-containing protein [Hyphomicrobiales bacterium]
MTSKSDGLRLENLAMHFGGVHVFEDVSMRIPPGQVTACIGPNGAGKTTLINIICGVLAAPKGRVFLDGEPLDSTPPHQMVQRGVGRTFQDVRIFPSLTAIENVLIAIPDQQGERLRHLFRPGRSVGAEERRNRDKANALLATVAMDDVADRPAGELPFGQQKLVSLLRAVATGARILLLDESAAGVEIELIPRITALVRRLVAEESRGVLLVEHNIDVVREIADHVVVLQGGGVIASGPCDSVLNDERVIKEYLGRIYNA